MKKLIPVILSILMLTGCTQGARLENQAHVVTMGIDYKDELITITAQVPGFGGGSGDGEKKNGSEYQIYKASGKNFLKAYNVLCASVPQEINLSHLKSIVFSEEFASSNIFLDTIETFLNMFSMSANAIVIVSRNDAAEIVENQKPYIGIRLSQILPAMLDYRKESGYVPECTLSKLYAGMLSFYSTPVSALAETGKEKSDTGNNEAYLPGEMMREGMNKNEYMGTALFDRRKMTGILNGRETQLMHFLSGERLRNVQFTEPADMHVSCEKVRDVVIVTDEERVRIKADIYLEIALLSDDVSFYEIAQSLAEDFKSVLHKAFALGCEPFGFSEIAAKDFLTIDEWNEFLLKNPFRNAQIEVNVHIRDTK